MKKYGNLIGTDFAGISAVVVTGLPLIKEVLTSTDQNFLNRPLSPIRKRVFGNNGKFLDYGMLEMDMVW